MSITYIVVTVLAASAAAISAIADLLRPDAEGLHLALSGSNAVRTAPDALARRLPPGSGRGLRARRGALGPGRERPPRAPPPPGASRRSSWPARARP